MSEKKAEAPPATPERESLGLSPAVLAKRTLYKAELWGPHIDPLMEYYDSWSDPYKPRKIHYSDIVKAHHFLKDKIPVTPLTKANRSNEFNMNLYFKRETVHKSGSFHERGAIYALHKLNNEQRKHGIFTTSFGNWAVALSHHAGRLKIPLTAYIPFTCQGKYIQVCRNNGATIVQENKSFNELKTKALQKMRQTTRTTNCYISGYDHPDVIAAAGTIAIEILEQLPNVDAVLVPVGGGGLIAGIATVVKKLKPNTLVYGFQSYEKCCFHKALHNGKPSEIKTNYAIQTAGYNAFYTAESLIDKVLLVDDDCIAQALLYFLEEERFIVERKAGEPMAVLFARPNIVPELRDKNVVCVISGGCIDLTLFPRAMLRARAVTGRMMTLRLALPVGRTDLWAKIFKVLSNIRCSIMPHNMSHNWMVPEDLGRCYVTMVCETKGPEHAATVRNVVNKLYPGQVQFTNYTHSLYTPTCPCYPKMWQDTDP